MCVAGKLVGQKVGKVLEHHIRVIPVLIGAVVVLVAILVVVAMSLMGAASLNAGETLRRAAYPASGVYILSVTAKGPANVTLESQNKEDTIVHTSTVLYLGPADGEAVEVAEGQHCSVCQCFC